MCETVSCEELVYDSLDREFEITVIKMINEVRRAMHAQSQNL